MHAHVQGLSQPQLRACSKPSTDSPIPAATRTAPAQSMGSRRATEWMPAATVSTTAMTAIGRLIQKIDRQVHSVR